MKTTINRYEFRAAFERLRPTNFSDQALGLLFDYFTDYEESTGEEIELDVIAICCEYTESTIDEVIDSYRLDIPEDATDEGRAELVIDYLQDHTGYIGQTDKGSVVYQIF